MQLALHKTITTDELVMGLWPTLSDENEFKKEENGCCWEEVNRTV